VDDLTISHVNAANVRRFIETAADPEASVSGLVVSQATVRGFSKDAVRLQNDTHDVLVEDVLVDSQGQDGDRFAMGFHLTGTVHDVVFRRVIAMNARDTTSDYWNGDGFVAERGTYGIRFEDTRANNNTDAGYDVKARNVAFVRATASGNKRNFRLWGSGIRMSSSRGANPIRRGGGGTQAQVWAGPAARFVIERSRFAGGDSNTIVFDLGRAAVGVAERTTVSRAPGSTLCRLSDGAEMTLNGERLTN
jgi:serralysin